MPVVGIGMDIARISRIQQSVERYQQRFLRRIYHPDETETAFRRKQWAEYLAACFAAKEATLKALGDFPGRGIEWREIQVAHELTGKPRLIISGKARILCDEKGVTHTHLTLTHDGDYALAQVLLEWL